VLEAGADKAAVEKAIVTMPNYFSDYDTTVHFISEEELQQGHAGLAHGGFVIRSGATGASSSVSSSWRISWNFWSAKSATPSSDPNGEAPSAARAGIATVERSENERGIA